MLSEKEEVNGIDMNKSIISYKPVYVQLG